MAVVVHIFSSYHQIVQSIGYELRVFCKLLILLNNIDSQPVLYIFTVSCPPLSTGFYGISPQSYPQAPRHISLKSLSGKALFFVWVLLGYESTAYYRANYIR